MEDLVEKACRIAFKAHEGQVRKADGGPYFDHPKAVAMKLMHERFPAVAVAAAFAHDVLEDTKIPEAVLVAELGSDVTAIVKTVTQDGRLSWKEKKEKYIESVRNGSELAKAVCVADKIHNLESLLKAWKEQGEDVWKKFNATKEEKLWFEQSVLKMLKETWQHPLVDEYQKLIRRFEKEVHSATHGQKLSKIGEASVRLHSENDDYSENNLLQALKRVVQERKERGQGKDPHRFALSEEGFLFDMKELKAWSPSQKDWVITSLTLGVMFDSRIISPEEAERLMVSSQGLKEPPTGEVDRVKEGLRYRVDMVDLFHSSDKEGYDELAKYRTLDEAVSAARDFTDENIKGFKSKNFMSWRTYGEAALVYDLETGELVWDGIDHGEKTFQGMS